MPRRKFAFWCDTALTENAPSDILSRMPISPSDKEDVISTVLIELERMFTVLTVRYPVTLPEHTLLLKKIEVAFRDGLSLVDQPQTKRISPFKAAADGF